MKYGFPSASISCSHLLLAEIKANCRIRQYNVDGSSVFLWFFFCFSLEHSPCHNDTNNGEEPHPYQHHHHHHIHPGARALHAPRSPRVYLFCQEHVCELLRNLFAQSSQRHFVQLLPLLTWGVLCSQHLCTAPVPCATTPRARLPPATALLPKSNTHKSWY